MLTIYDVSARGYTLGIAPRQGRAARAASMLRYVAGGTPPDMALLRSPSLKRRLWELIAGVPFDVVQIESAMAPYAHALPLEVRRRTVIMFQNVTAQLLRRVAGVEGCWRRRLRARLNGTMMARWEPREASRFARCTTVSESDRQLLIAGNPRARVDVVPNGVDLKDKRCCHGRRLTSPRQWYSSEPWTTDRALMRCSILS